MSPAVRASLEEIGFGAAPLYALLAALTALPTGQVPTADEIVDRMIAAHGSSRLDQAVVSFELFGAEFRVLHEGGPFRYEQARTGSSGERTVDWIDNSGAGRTVGGVPVRLSEDERILLDSNVNGGRYLVLMPHRLDDVQAQHLYLGTARIGDRTHHVVETRFTPEAGLGADTVWVFWIREDDYTLAFRAFDFLPAGAVQRQRVFHRAVNARRVGGVRFTDWIGYAPPAGRTPELRDMARAWEAHELDEQVVFEPRNISVREVP